MDRRQFLIGISALGFTLTPISAFLSKASPVKETNLSQQVSSFRALFEHLLPSEQEAPGAHEINAIGYLQWVLKDPKVNNAYRLFLLAGIQNLDEVSFKQTRKHFIELSHDAREKVLRALETTTEGYRWLKEILEFLMEALLGDPIYGGNTGEAGWKWLQHVPGFPRPLPNKRYFLL